MDSINNNLSTRQLSPELQELLDRRAISVDKTANADAVNTSKGQIEELTIELQTGEITQDPNIATDIAEVISSSMDQNAIGNINFKNDSGFGSGEDDGHDTSEARKIKSELMAST